MTDITQTVPLGAARRLDLARLFGAEPLFAATGMLFALSLLATLPAMALDPRLFQGESIWLKPVKFQIALAIYMLSLAFFARWLPEGMTAKRRYRVFAAAVVVSVLGEMLWIGGAAMMGTASHFNTGTPVMAALYSLMGIFAVTLLSASLVFGIAIWRNRATGLSAPLRISVALGLIMTFALTLPVAATLSSMSGHLVGTPELGLRVPVFGWSREVGDLRVAHFFATHAMHAIPVAGLLAARALPDRRAVGAVWLAALAFTGLVAYAFLGALAGLPLIPAG